MGLGFACAFSSKKDAVLARAGFARGGRRTWRGLLAECRDYFRRRVYCISGKQRQTDFWSTIALFLFCRAGVRFRPLTTRNRRQGPRKATEKRELHFTKH